MSADVTPNQALLLFGILAVHGECAQAELMPAVDRADREALEKAGLIGVKKENRSLYLSLTDRGWDWTGAHLTAELPSPQRALHELLARLSEHFARHGGSLASLIGSKPASPADIKPPAMKVTKVAKPKAAKAGTDGKSAAMTGKQTSKPAQKPVSKPAETKAVKKADKSPAPAKTAKSKTPTFATLRKRIEAAYLSLTGGRKNESVRIARLRDALADLDRATLDAALGRILKGDEKVSLMRHDDPGQLGPADHAAAYSPAGEPFHIIWIAS